jgi:hypothetical protein
MKIQFVQFDGLDLQNQILRRKSRSHLDHEDIISCYPMTSSTFICMVNWSCHMRCMSYKMVGGSTPTVGGCTLTVGGGTLTNGG